MSVQVLSPQEFRELQSSNPGLHIVDVRTPAEFQEVHLTVASNIPLDRLSVQDIPNDGKPVVFVCKSGTRGRMACEKFLGRERVYNIEGGTQACVEAGLPVVRGKKIISLERQVRIAAGTLVVAGVALSWVHPYFLALSAFVGAGLVFAGVTDTCGMGMLLAKMPWNQVSKKSDNSGACAVSQ